MKVIGLTGGIGMGKSTAAATFRRARIPVFDADATVHRLQGRGGRAVRAIEAPSPAPPATARWTALPCAAPFWATPTALRRLEAILHPMVRAEERAFVARARRAGKRVVVLDIPLFSRPADARWIASSWSPRRARCRCSACAGAGR